MLRLPALRIEPTEETRVEFIRGADGVACEVRALRSAVTTLAALLVLLFVAECALELLRRP